MSRFNKLAAAVVEVNRITYWLRVFVSQTGLPSASIKEKIIPIPVYRGGAEVAKKKMDEELLKLEWQGLDVRALSFRDPNGNLIEYE